MVNGVYKPTYNWEAPPCIPMNIYIYIYTSFNYKSIFFRKNGTINSITNTLWNVRTALSLARGSCIVEYVRVPVAIGVVAYCGSMAREYLVGGEVFFNLLLPIVHGSTFWLSFYGTVMPIYHHLQYFFLG